MLGQIGPYLRKYKYLVEEKKYVDEMWNTVWVFEWSHSIFDFQIFLHGF